LFVIMPPDGSRQQLVDAVDEMVGNASRTASSASTQVVS
jgi:hypothetical protein